MKEKSVTRKLAKTGIKTPTEGTAFDTKPLMNKLSNLGFYSNQGSPVKEEQKDDG